MISPLCSRNVICLLTTSKLLLWLHNTIQITLYLLDNTKIDVGDFQIIALYLDIMLQFPSQSKSGGSTARTGQTSNQPAGSQVASGTASRTAGQSSSQPSSQQSKSYTETSGPDGSASRSSEADGSSATPPASSAGDGSSVKTNQDNVDINLFGKDPKNPNETVELNDQHYDLNNLGGGSRKDYDFKAEVKCTLIKMDGKELWKHGEHKCQDYPTCISYTNQSSIVVYLGNGSLRYGKDSEGTWKFELANNLKTSGDGTPDPSSQGQTGTDQSGGGKTGTHGSGGTGTGGSGTGSGEGTGTNEDGTGTGGGDGSRTGDGGSTGSGEDGSGSPSGGSSYTGKEGEDVTSGGSGSPSGGQDPGTKTGAADTEVQEKTNKSSSSKKKSSSGGFSWFTSCCSKSS
ncbi:hypothetical protein MACK_000419 [Theileria orientalis]|uniref:SfiI-subtelomeric related protein family member n=1 Tax=Theileria orientalis TaxID=68886 RepID=A0A976QUC4_THEOR|nr:hypothetical protein MACK_000419 [Theileria orientalis]